MDLNEFLKSNCLNLTELAKKSGIAYDVLFKLKNRRSVSISSIMKFHKCLKEIQSNISKLKIEDLMLWIDLSTNTNSCKDDKPKKE